MYTHRQSRTPHILIWLRSPWIIAVSVLLGIYLGTCQPKFAVTIAPFGTFYLGLLKMCVLPILLSAITGSIGRLMMTSNASQSIRRILIVFPLALLLVSTTAVIIASIAGPGRNLPEAMLKTLGALINQSGIDLEISLNGPVAQSETFDINQFVLNLVPDNIFSALSEGQTLKVLVFAIIFGVALGFVQEPVTERLFEILESVYKSFNKLICWLTFLLPFGLCSLLAAQLSQLGIDVLLSMINFVIVVIFTFVFIYCLCTLIIWKQTKFSLAHVLSALREPTILALATSSSLACIPSAIASLSETLKFDRETIQLVTPLSITICRFGSVTYFALSTLFVAQLYHKELSTVHLGIIIVVSILAGMATSGATGVITLTMLDIVLSPLKLPLEAVLVLFIAIDPIMDPFRTLCIVQTGMATTAVIAEPEKARVKTSSVPISSQFEPAAPPPEFPQGQSLR